MYRKHTSFTTEVEDVTVELAHEPLDWLDMLTAKVGDHLVVAYCVSDQDYRDVDDLMGDCMGRIVDAYNGRDAERRELYELMGCDSYGDKDLDAVWDRHEDAAIERYVKKVREDYTVAELLERIDDDEVVTEEEIDDHLRHDARSARWTDVEFEDALQRVLDDMWDEPAYWPGNHDAVLLDVYSHSGQVWSISGGGMRCRWDTSSEAGAWVPDDCLLKEIEAGVAKGEVRRALCVKYAGQFLNTYNEIISGNVYGCVVEWFDADGTAIDNDACWGFIGTEHAEESLKAEFFEPMLRRT